jgi:sodium-dependent dicarboxylate transporter 2/3/5
MAYFLINKFFLKKVIKLPISQDVIERSTQVKPLIFREKYVLGVFFITVGLWLTQSLIRPYLPMITDSSISIFGASLLFLSSIFKNKAHKVISWKDTEKLPWGVLLLFGGGLTLASQIQKTGLASWIGDQFYILKDYPLLLSLLIVILAGMIMTEFTSNTAVAAALIPIVASVSVTIGYSPLLLSIPIIFAANSSFMLPIATPPNAIVYGTGFLNLYDMAKAGFFLKIFMTLFILAFTALFAQLIFGI